MAGLVLSRKVGQRVFVGDGLAITVTSVRGSTVKLHFECDRSTNIRREELDPPDDCRDDRPRSEKGKD